MESGPRVGTRVDRAEEGRCEGEEVLRDLTGLIVTLIGHNFRVDLDVSLGWFFEDLSGLMVGNAETWVESCPRVGT